jgi:hypothetical protein
MCGIETCTRLFVTPGEGIHKPRICGLAAIDLFLTMCGAYWMSGPSLPLCVIAFIILWAFGILCHLAFGIKTPMIVWLFRDNDHYGLFESTKTSHRRVMPSGTLAE